MNNPDLVTGTSPATAFISGLVADVRSIASKPALAPCTASVPDWYDFSFNRQPGDPSGLHVEVDVPVQDPSAGSLSIKPFQEGPTKGSFVSIPLMPSQPSSVNGTATVIAIMSTNRTYMIEVDTTSNAQIDDNCYAGVIVKTGDSAPEPCDAFNPLACFK